MPVVQPAELWQESGRWSAYGPELLRFKDRHERDFILQPTSEEVITEIARAELRSYRKLPVHFYQIQTKFRDERRPRFGVMRGREFIMKDGYSFHADYADLEREYRNMYDTYTRIFTRLGLKFRAVAADTGAIGGTGSHEFQVLADSGEDAIAWSDGSDYAANLELAEAVSPFEKRKDPGEDDAKGRHAGQDDLRGRRRAAQAAAHAHGEVGRADAGQDVRAAADPRRSQPERNQGAARFPASIRSALRHPRKFKPI